MHRPWPGNAGLWSPQATQTVARASMAGGVTCSGKAFVSQCAPEAPIGVTFRQKVLRYQRTAYFVLNRASPAHPAVYAVRLIAHHGSRAATGRRRATSRSRLRG